MEPASACFTQFVPFVFMGIMIAIAVVATIYSQNQMKKHLQELAATFDSPQIGGFAPIFLEGYYKGKKVRIELVSGGKNSPPYLTIKLFADIPFTLTISQEGTMTKLGKKIGLVREMEIGIPDFDDKFLIQSGQPDMAKQYLMNEINRRIVDSIIKTGFTSIDARDGKLLILKPTYNQGAETRPSFVHPLLDGLIVMSQSF